MLKPLLISVSAASLLVGCDAFIDGFNGSHNESDRVTINASLSDAQACLNYAQIEDKSGNIIYIPKIPEDAVTRCETAYEANPDNISIAIAFVRSLSKDEDRHDEIEAIISKFEPDETGQIDYVRSVIFTRGDGVAKNKDTALDFAKTSAGKGFVPAMDEVGDRLSDNADTDAAEAEAVTWWKMAADAGHSQGYFSMADSYYYGYGVEKDLTKAFEYSKLSAEMGNFRGQNYYAYMLERGEGGEKNSKEALRYYTLSAEQGFSVAQANLGDTYYYGSLAPEDNEKARIWFEKAAKQGNLKAYFYLGEIYRKGYGVTVDHTLALYNYRKAANKDYARAFNALGLMAKDGEGMNQNYELAKDYFTRGLDFDCFNCLPNIGLLYERGQGVDKDMEKAIEYYTQSAENGNSWSSDKLGQLYLKGRGVEKDVDLAINYYLQAVEDNDRESSAKAIDTFILENEDWRDLVSEETVAKIDAPRAKWRKLSRG